MLVTFQGCANKLDMAKSQQYKLYEKVGGAKGIETLTENFIKEIVNDPQIFPYFAKTNVTHFRQGFQQHLCATLDGPCEYKGDTMEDIHTGMNISESDFNRTVELLINAMDASGIDYREQNLILAKLAPMRGQIYKR
jgi:hemoglobin